jgi:hypothetical protein
MTLAALSTKGGAASPAFVPLSRCRARVGLGGGPQAAAGTGIDRVIQRGLSPGPLERLTPAWNSYGYGPGARVA